MIKRFVEHLKNFMNTRDGMALVLVLVFTLLLLAAGAALLEMTLKDLKITGYHAADIKQYYLAEAGIETSLFLLNSGIFIPDDLHHIINDGSFAVSFADFDHESIILYSTGSIGRGSTTLTVRVEQSEDGIYRIAEWIKP